MEKLQKVGLDFNYFDSVPPCMCALKNLEWASFSGQKTGKHIPKPETMRKEVRGYW